MNAIGCNHRPSLAGWRGLRDVEVHALFNSTFYSYGEADRPVRLCKLYSLAASVVTVRSDYYGQCVRGADSAQPTLPRL